MRTIIETPQGYKKVEKEIERLNNRYWWQRLFDL